jgi:hypothetical protein
MIIKIKNKDLLNFITLRYNKTADFGVEYIILDKSNVHYNTYKVINNNKFLIDIIKYGIEFEVI